MLYYYALATWISSKKDTKVSVVAIYKIKKGGGYMMNSSNISLIIISRSVIHTECGSLQMGMVGRYLHMCLYIFFVWATDFHSTNT